VPAEDKSSSRRDQVMATGVELTIRLGVLGLLLYWSFFLIRPFITIAIWSVVLTVALYPVYDWIADRLGGRRRLAAVLLTFINLLIVIGPATWLALGLIDSLRTLSDRLDPSILELPAPPVTVKDWALIGEPVYQFWNLASTNLQGALAKIAPQLKPLGSLLVQIAADAGTGIIKFFIAIVIAGFLFSPAPSLVDALRSFSRTVAAGRGETFVQTAGATIRAVSRGVIGISILQALLAGLGVIAVGIPGTRVQTH
jgi:predicted PurR-regulated permease PerM